MGDIIRDVLAEEQAASLQVKEEFEIATRKLHLITDTLSQLIQKIKFLNANRTPPEDEERIAENAATTIIDIDTQQQEKLKAIKGRRIKQVQLLQQILRNTSFEIKGPTNSLDQLIWVLDDQIKILKRLIGAIKNKDNEKISILWDSLLKIESAETRLVKQLQIDDQEIQALLQGLRAQRAEVGRLIK